MGLVVLDKFDKCIGDTITLDLELAYVAFPGTSDSPRFQE